MEDSISFERMIESGQGSSKASHRVSGRWIFKASSVEMVNTYHIANDCGELDYEIAACGDRLEGRLFLNHESDNLIYDPW